MERRVTECEKPRCGLMSFCEYNLAVFYYPTAVRWCRKLHATRKPQGQLCTSCHLSSSSATHIIQVQGRGQLHQICGIPVDHSALHVPVMCDDKTSHDLFAPAVLRTVSHRKRTSVTINCRQLVYEALCSILEICR